MALLVISVLLSVLFLLVRYLRFGCGFDLGGLLCWLDDWYWWFDVLIVLF